NNLAAIRTDQVIVMIAVVKFEHSLAAVKLTANQDAGLFKLRENAIHGRQTDVHVFVDQGSIHIFSAKMALVGLAKNIENIETREGRFQAHILQFILVVHRRSEEHTSELQS